MFIRYVGKKKDFTITFTRKPYHIEGPGSVVEVTLVKDFNQLMSPAYVGSFQEVSNAEGDPMPPDEADEVSPGDETDEHDDHLEDGVPGRDTTGKSPSLAPRGRRRKAAVAV